MHKNEFYDCSFHRNKIREYNSFLFDWSLPQNEYVLTIWST